MLSLEDQFLFFPTKYPHGNWKPDGLEFEDVFFTAPDGMKLHGWYCPVRATRGRWCCTRTGNGGTWRTPRSLMRYYQQRLRVTSFIFDYRGYGRSEGTPTVAAILQDARAARKWLATRPASRSPSSC